ncbi:5'-3' exoribonuclease 3-like [Tasmannia lanceolata]|uniref:5'-3' exoribonuclease 3-like n=1 Tax=Tasmannia lanceolata TaxID=3420 RepID=UPI004062E2E5
MGVPSFYRWLVNKYPKIVQNAVIEKGESVDLTQPNPNGMEFDNLYLDMNGIIHPCFHPEDDLFPPKTFDEVFKSIFEYIDQIFRIVRPRKLLYMAIDGVAPRAKMNQQRSRRFQAALNSKIAEEEEEKLRREFELEGKILLPKQESEVSDSNVITPGTVFMDKLSKALKYYIHLRLNGDPGWSNIKVIISDANVPGEGEHKIMSFIRLQRNLPGYDPNTRHCLHGLDADLIMLALATHEVHFSILREDVLTREQHPNFILSPVTRLCKEGSALPSSGRCFRGGSLANVPYQFLNVWILREYLELDMKIPDPSFLIDFERIVDDFIFICFFTGNDFLPRLPSLEINEGAIDLLMTVYKAEFKRMGGYLVDSQRIKDKKAAYMKLSRVALFILAVGSYEDRIFTKRSKLREIKLKKMLHESLVAVGGDDLGNAMENSMHQDCVLEPNFRQGSHGMSYEKISTSRTSKTIPISQNDEIGVDNDAFQNTKELMQKLKEIIRDKSDLFKHGSLERDMVKLGLPGWKERFYKEKFSAESSTEIQAARKKIVHNYTEGLCWVLHYYFGGVCSWTWYYNSYYGPFASDLKGLTQSRISFEMRKPFKPFDQLMGVLPPRSAHALPKAYRDLMTCKEPNIEQFYPTDFEVDTDGKRYLWQGVTKLPFVEEELLTSVTRNLQKELTDDEISRNSETFDKIFVRASHDFGIKVSELISGKKRVEIKDCIGSQTSGLNGFLCLFDEASQPKISSSPLIGMEDITEDDVISALYEGPESHDHIPRPPENVKIPPRTIEEADIQTTQLWHEYEGWQPRQSSRYTYLFTSFSLLSFPKNHTILVMGCENTSLSQAATCPRVGEIQPLTGCHLSQSR